MPRDPARIADTKAWLGKAGTDLRAAALDLAAEPPRGLFAIGIHAAVSGGSGCTAYRVRVEVSLPGRTRGANPR